MSKSYTDVYNSLYKFPAYTHSFRRTAEQNLECAALFDGDFGDDQHQARRKHAEFLNEALEARERIGASVSDLSEQLITDYEFILNAPGNCSEDTRATAAYGLYFMYIQTHDNTKAKAILRRIMVDREFPNLLSGDHYELARDFLGEDAITDLFSREIERGTRPGHEV